MGIAHFQCLKCLYSWTSNPGPTQCPACGHDYVKWLNYEEMRKEWDKNEQGTGSNQKRSKRCNED